MKIVATSVKFGFTKFTKNEYAQLVKDGKIIPDGVNVKVISGHGPLKRLAIFK